MSSPHPHDRDHHDHHDHHDRHGHHDRRDRHDHGPHAHGHRHGGEWRHPAARPVFSLLRLSLVQRVALALPLAALLWAAALWVIGSSGA